MNAISEKVFLSLKMPTEDLPVSDHKRICLALEQLGYGRIKFPLRVLQSLYPLCRKGNFDITVTLVFCGDHWVVTGVEAGDTTSAHYGLAVDYGSTTIVMQMVDLRSGAVLDEVKQVSGQTVYGTDILTRITYAMESDEHKADLQKAAVNTLEALMGELTENTGIDAFRLPVMVLSGNTTMIHFLLKLDAWTVFASPYAPVTEDPGFLSGAELELGFSGLVYIVPAVSNYVGGDIVSGLLTIGLHNAEETSMFFDIGTNGELVVGNKDWLVAGAGAAGPALEGYISRFGMRAGEGAVDSVRINGEQIFVTTIENQKPVGICGSGIIDLLAQMRLNGWINVAGELEPKASSRIIWLEEEKQYAAVYASAQESASGEMLFFTQTDIDQYLDTKAASFTMVDSLLEQAGVAAEDLAAVHLSGAFAAHSNPESAITIGMYPDLPRQRFFVHRNTSLDGARFLLLNRFGLQEIQEIRDKISCVQFASIPDFLIRMQAAKFIPHTDMERFPNIQRMLNKVQ